MASPALHGALPHPTQHSSPALHPTGQGQWVPRSRTGSKNLPRGHQLISWECCCGGCNGRKTDVLGLENKMVLAPVGCWLCPNSPHITMEGLTSSL